MLLLLLPCTAQGTLLNKYCNAYTFADVPRCMAECIRDCTLSAQTMGTPGTSPANKNQACKREEDICGPQKENFRCDDAELKLWESYVSGGCKLNTVAGRCSECLRNGCSFCDRRESLKAGSTTAVPSERVSFCWNSDAVPHDPYYGKCDKEQSEDLLKIYSNSEDEDSICADTIAYIPIAAVLLYLIIVVICPMFVFGFVWYSICFGVPRKFREVCCNTSSASVFVEPPNSNDFSHYGNWQGRTAARAGPGGRMYVIPSDTVPAEVSLSTRSGPEGAIQTGVILHPSGNSVVMNHYGQVPVDGPPISIVRSNVQPSAGSSQKEIPITYAQEL